MSKRPTAPDLERRRQTNKHILKSAAWVAGVFIALGIIGAVFGEDSKDSTTNTSDSTKENESKPTRSAEPSKTAAPSQTAEPSDSAEKAALVARAEKIVADELPDDVPLCRGTTFKGTYISTKEVCVDRTYGPNGGLNGTGGNAGYVVVTFQNGTTGEPKDGTCAKPAPEPVDWQSKIEDEIKDKLGSSNRDDVMRVASVVYVDAVNVPVIKWAINENLTEGLTKKGAKMDVRDMLEVLQKLQKDGMQLKGATFEGTYSLVDQLGNESEDRVVLAR